MGSLLTALRKYSFIDNVLVSCIYCLFFQIELDSNTIIHLSTKSVKADLDLPMQVALVQLVVSLSIE